MPYNSHLLVVWHCLRLHHKSLYGRGDYSAHIHVGDILIEITQSQGGNGEKKDRYWTVWSKNEPTSQEIDIAQARLHTGQVKTIPKNANAMLSGHGTDADDR